MIHCHRVMKLQPASGTCIEELAGNNHSTNGLDQSSGANVLLGPHLVGRPYLERRADGALACKQCGQGQRAASSSSFCILVSEGLGFELMGSQQKAF